MNLANLLVFAAAYMAVVILPGPGVTALVARVLARGPQGSAAFIVGFVAGSLTWFTIAATGLAVVAATFATVFLVIRYVGAAYLLYLATRLWKAPVRPLAGREATPDDHGRLFLTGMAINLGNPKVIVFFLALLPTVVDLARLTPLSFAELALVIIAVAGSVLAAYTLAAIRARSLFRSERALRLMNRSSSVVMAGAAVTIVAR